MGIAKRAEAQRFWMMAALFLALAGLGGCGLQQDSERKPVTLTPRLAEIYSHTCIACHTVPDSGAPQTHHVAAWTPRLKKGETALLDHMVNGFGGMPPLGQCIECNADDLTTLMHFMAAPAPAAADQADTQTDKEKTAP